MKKTKWGFIGTGTIANCMAQALKGIDGAELFACAARSKEKAEIFATKWNFTKSFASYDELFADTEVQVVYIATPHMNHAELSIKAMLAGKAVLCEKPAAVNADELKKVLETSQKTGLFFMEAMWTRYQPAFSTVMNLIAEGKIGTLKTVYADICCATPYTPGSRLYEPSLAGGALLDVGIYALTAAFSSVAAFSSSNIGSFSSAIPDSISAICRKTVTGVDGFDAINLTFQVGGGDKPKSTVMAILTAAIDAGGGKITRGARFVGSLGSIYLPEFWYSQEYVLVDPNGTVIEQKKLPFRVNGYEYEAEEVMRCLTDKSVIQSNIHTQADTMHLLVVMDAIRKQWNLTYPFEGIGRDVTHRDDTHRDDTHRDDTHRETSSLLNNACESEITIYTDGACSGNPGKGGWGAVLIIDGKETKLSGGEKLTTNNKMELMGAINALESILTLPNVHNKKVTIICDSQYVKNGIQTWIINWKKNGWKTASKEPVKNKDLWIRLDNVVNELKLEWKWVKGHNGNKYNEICDTLAVEAAKKQ